MEYGIWNIHNGLWATNTIVYSDTSAAYTNTLPHYSCNNTAIATIPNILKTMVPSTLNEDGNETQQSDSGTNDSTQHSNSSHNQTQVQNKQLKTDHDATKFMKKLIINNVKIEDSFAYINQQLNPVYHLLLNHLTQQQELSNCESYENSESIKEIEENESNNKQERELFECSICHVNMKSSDELKSHLEVKHFNNEVIVSTFTSVQSEIGDGNYNENSNSSIKRQDRLSLQRVRYEREEYHCTFCSYTCTIEKAFYRHLRAHSNCLNDKEYITPRISCVICGKDRASENDMVRHMQKHKDNRHFCCDICVFRTVQLKKLIQHRRMHTGEKPHLCPHCIYRSARRDNLRSHVRRVHKKDNLFCDTFSPRGLLLSSKARNINDDKC